MRNRLFTALALALAVGLAAAASPYASSSPDGLERVAGDTGFAASRASRIARPRPTTRFPASRTRVYGVPAPPGSRICSSSASLGSPPSCGGGLRRRERRRPLARADRPAGDPASPVHRLDPRAKLLGFVAITCTAVSAPLDGSPVYAGCALALVALAAAEHAHTIWRRARAVLLLVLFAAVFVPFVDRGGDKVAVGPLMLSAAGLAVLGTVAAKATIGTVSAVLLGATTSYPAVLRALESLPRPQAITVIAAFSYRYLFVLTDEAAHDARRARRARVPAAHRARRGRDRPARRLAVPARARARGTRIPCDGGAWICRLDARARAADVPARRRGVPRRAGRGIARPRVGVEVAGELAIHASGVRFRYPDGRVALDGVDLHVGHGERVAILGPNGAGKTTLMLHLNGLLTGEGKLEVAGLEVGRRTLRELARVGLVFQDPDDQLFMPTVREDVAFGPLNLGLSAAEAGARGGGAGGGADGDHERSPRQLSMRITSHMAMATVLANAAAPARAAASISQPGPARAARAAGHAARRARAALLIVTRTTLVGSPAGCCSAR